MVVNLTKAEILLHRARDGSEVPRRQHLACSLALRDGRLDSCSRIGTRVPGCIQRAAGGEQVRACHGGDGWKIPPRRFVIEEVEKLVFDKGTPQADSRLMPNRSEEHTSELQSPCNLVCRLLLEKKKKNKLDRIIREKEKIRIFMNVHVCVLITHMMVFYVIEYE